jgi:hypothetical protein
MKYDVFYKPDSNGNMSFDNDRKLPEPDDQIAYAHNVNGDGHYVIPAHGEWLIVTRKTALGRSFMNKEG